MLYQYPAYTGLSPRTVTSSGDLSGPKGTVVQLRTRADRTVNGAQLQLSTGAVVPLRVENGRDLSGSLVLQATGTYAMVFTGRTGREAARGPDFPLTVEPDAPPQVSILLPGGELEVDPEQEVLLRWEASDDYGLSDLALVWTGPDGQSHRQKLAHDDGRKSSGQYRWQLAPLKLGPGDRVTYAVEALDNDAVDGPQKGTSREQTLVVYSAAEHRREALRRAAELWERLVAHLATRMEGPDRDARKSEDKVRAQEPVDTSGLVLAGDLVGTARALARERDRNEALVSALEHVGQDVAARVRSTSDTPQAVRSGSPADAPSWTWTGGSPAWRRRRSARWRRTCSTSSRSSTSSDSRSCASWPGSWRATSASWPSSSSSSRAPGIPGSRKRSSARSPRSGSAWRSWLAGWGSCRRASATSTSTWRRCASWPSNRTCRAGWKRSRSSSRRARPRRPWPSSSSSRPR